MSETQHKSQTLAAGQPVYIRVVHLLAVILTVAVFPLIWVGGLVTTYDAGMAVPDWPGTYGENMFAYKAWLFGPFDLMVEHGHRLLGSLAGLLSIGLVAAAWRWERRRWFVVWTIFVLLAVIAQGVLGGVRVLLDARTFAMIHGCTGPLFFALATATAVMSSRWWIERPQAAAGLHKATENESNADQANPAVLGQNATGGWVLWLAPVLLLFSYLQLVMGAQLRHATGLLGHKAFKGFVHTHLGLAGVVFVLALLLGLMAAFSGRMPAKVSRVAVLLSFVVLVQLGLGIGTWIVNYALPWPELNASLASYTIHAKGYWESLIVTAHMATGSLIISLATVVALRAWRSRIPTGPAA
jgi:cytochrome c oxidase assembly protein subunit 15